MKKNIIELYLLSQWESVWHFTSHLTIVQWKAGKRPHQNHYTCTDQPVVAHNFWKHRRSRRHRDNLENPVKSTPFCPLLAILFKQLTRVYILYYDSLFPASPAAMFYLHCVSTLIYLHFTSVFVNYRSNGEYRMFKWRTCWCSQENS